MEAAAANLMAAAAQTPTVPPLASSAVKERVIDERTHHVAVAKEIRRLEAARALRSAAIAQRHGMGARLVFEMAPSRTAPLPSLLTLHPHPFYSSHFTLTLALTLSP